MDDPPEQDPLTVLITAVADGTAAGPGRQALELALVDRARENGASWSQLGALLWKCAGPEAKRRVHHLRAEVERARRLEENREG